jgi:hypothetical protein
MDNFPIVLAVILSLSSVIYYVSVKLKLAKLDSEDRTRKDQLFWDDLEPKSFSARRKK